MLRGSDSRMLRGSDSHEQVEGCLRTLFRSKEKEEKEEKENKNLLREVSCGISVVIDLVVS